MQGCNLLNVFRIHIRGFSPFVLLLQVSKSTDDRKIFSGSRDKLLEILHIYFLEGSELMRRVISSERSISEYETLNNNVLNEQHISEDKKEIIAFLSFNRKDFII